MIYRWEKALFFSDSHAGGGGKADDLTRWSPLLGKLLRECEKTKTAVVAVGDIGENWQFSPTKIAKHHGATFEPLGRLIDQGLGVYVPGNHDLESGAAAQLLGMPWACSSCVVDTGKAKFWIEHGHRWDPHNRKPGWPHRLLLAATKKLERVWPDIDVIDRRRAADRRAPKDESKDPLYAGARRILNSGRWGGVIMGHTHRAGLWWIRTRFGMLPYANCGAWTNARTPSVVVVEGARVGVVTLRSVRDFKEIWS